jgi:hypothetical protein
MIGYWLFGGDIWIAVSMMWAFSFGVIGLIMLVTVRDKETAQGALLFLGAALLGGLLGLFIVIPGMVIALVLIAFKLLEAFGLAFNHNTHH